MDRIGYGLLLALGVLVSTVLITLASYFCTLSRIPSNPPRQRNSPSTATGHHSVVTVEPALNEATLQSYPKLLYSQARLQKGNSTASSSCSICLADYKNNDMLRLLPDCGHVFHLKCVDPWLRLNPSCPMCRNSPVPTPLSTPLAEVTPLARGTTS